MKSKIIFTLVVLLALFSESCKKEALQITTDDLIGYWIAEDITFDAIDKDYSMQLSLEKNKNYNQNYTSGNWSLNEGELILNPEEFYGIEKKNYKIVSLTENSLTLQIEMTDGEYCCDFEEFDNDKKLIIIEKYIRQQ